MTPLTVSPDPRAAGGAIQLKLREVAQLYNSFDPSPFNEKDLDHDAEEFIVSWARELTHHHDTLKLVLHLEKPLPAPHTPASIGETIQHYFAYRASINHLELRQLFKQGRLSLVIGGCFLTACLLLSELISQQAPTGTFREIARESLTIVGWVAMWRPMQIYLYDWWPLKQHGNLLAKLSGMKIEVRTSP